MPDKAITTVPENHWHDLQNDANSPLSDILDSLNLIHYSWVIRVLSDLAILCRLGLKNWALAYKPET